MRLISSEPGCDRHDSPARRWEYVKQFEQPDQLLPNTWVVVRIDGRGFTKYASQPAETHAMQSHTQTDKRQICQQVFLGEAQ